MLNLRGRRGLPTIVLLAAILAVVGHVCVVPVHAHATPVRGHGSHDHDADDHSVHTASCEALKSSSPVVMPTLVLALAPLTAPPTLLRHAYDDVAVVTCAPSPPLFLLHAALLI
jgi:hypothetical protein